jgi:hypothetical protein
MTTIVGRNVKVQVALTFAAADTVTALTLANPGVATSTAHGLVNGDVGYFSVTAGMVEIDQQAVCVDDKTNDAFDCSGVDTTGYTAWSAGTFTAAATWATVSEAAAYSIGGGAANQLDDTRLMDLKTRNVAGLLAPQDLTIDVKNGEEDSAAMAFIEAAAKNGTNCLFKITRGSTVLRVAYGVPSIPGESVQAGGLASGQFNVICPAWIPKPNVSLT